MPDVRDAGTSVREAAGRVRRWLRHLPDRLLHRRRHADALARIDALAPVTSVLVMCYGNVCRSPYLAALIRRSLPGVHVTSAGFVGPGRAAPPLAVAVAARRGEDITAHRSQLITADLGGAAKLVFVMDAEQAHELVLRYRVVPSRIIIVGDLDPLPIDSRRILDPWGRPREAFEASYARLERCASTFINTASAW